MGFESTASWGESLALRLADLLFGLRVFRLWLFGVLECLECCIRGNLEIVEVSALKYLGFRASGLRGFRRAWVFATPL